MIPGEIRCADTPLVLNEGRTRVRVSVRNSGDRPVQIGSHYHFFEVNPALLFERETAHGMHLDIPAGMAVRFEPGQAREVDLVPYAGRRHVYGFRGAVMGPLDAGAKNGRA